MSEMTKLDLLSTVEQLDSPHSGEVVVPREGVMLHYDDSTEDEWAVKWFRDPTCTVSYNRLYLDNGAVVSICEMSRRAYHAGPCLGGNANSKYYGLSAATDPKHKVQPRQLESMIEDTARIFRGHGWKKADVEKRIVGHDEMAIYGPQHTTNKALWGKLGRKVDPTGIPSLTAYPIISVPQFRILVAARLVT